MNRQRTRLLRVGLAIGGVTLAGALTAATAVADANASAQVAVSSTAVAGASTQVNPGLSFEEMVLTTPTVLQSPQVRQLISNLGPTVLRFGANGSSKLMWNMQVNARYRIGKANLQAVNALATATNSSVVLSTNLYLYSPQRSEQMISAAKSILGKRLLAAEFGNEPDLFYHNKNHVVDSGETSTGGGSEDYSPSQFVTEWNAYRAALLADPTTSSVPVLGPSLTSLGVVGGSLNSWATSWNLSAKRQKTDLFSQHTYALSGCGGAPWTVGDLTSDATYDRSLGVAAQTVNLARAEHLTPILGERNSISCSGRDGISNTITSALWMLDSELAFAQQGIAGQYIHSHFGVCGTTPGSDSVYWNSFYSPWCTPVGADKTTAPVVATPTYYGMLAAHLVGNGTFVRTNWVNDSPNSSVRMYALRQSGRLTVVVVNEGATDQQATVNLPKAWTSSGTWSRAWQANLTSTEHAPGARNGVSLGGGQVADATGVFSGPTWSRPAVSGGNSVSVSVPAESAAIVRIR